MAESENNTIEKLLLDFNNECGRYGEEFAEFQNVDLFRSQVIGSISAALINQDITPDEITEELIDAHAEAIVKDLMGMKKDVVMKLIKSLRISN